MFKVKESDKRIIGREETGFGFIGWPIYEYRCPVCDKWHKGSDVTQMNDDGTESVLCETCAGEVFPTNWYAIKPV